MVIVCAELGRYKSLAPELTPLSLWLPLDGAGEPWGPQDLAMCAWAFAKALAPDECDESAPSLSSFANWVRLALKKHILVHVIKIY